MNADGHEGAESSAEWSRVWDEIRDILLVLLPDKRDQLEQDELFAPALRQGALEAERARDVADVLREVAGIVSNTKTQRDNFLRALRWTIEVHDKKREFTPEAWQANVLSVVESDAGRII